MHVNTRYINSNRGTSSNWVTVGDSGLCCCTCVTYFERWLTPLCVDFLQLLVQAWNCTLFLLLLSLPSLNQHLPTTLMWRYLLTLTRASFKLFLKSFKQKTKTNKNHFKKNWGVMTFVRPDVLLNGWFKMEFVLPEVQTQKVQKNAYLLGYIYWG